MDESITPADPARILRPYAGRKEQRPAPLRAVSTFLLARVSGLVERRCHHELPQGKDRGAPRLHKRVEDRGVSYQQHPIGARVMKTPRRAATALRLRSHPLCPRRRGPDSDSALSGRHVPPRVGRRSHRFFHGIFTAPPSWLWIPLRGRSCRPAPASSPRPSSDRPRRRPPAIAPPRRVLNAGRTRSRGERERRRWRRDRTGRVVDRIESICHSATPDLVTGPGTTFAITPNAIHLPLPR